MYLGHVRIYNVSDAPDLINKMCDMLKKAKSSFVIFLRSGHISSLNCYTSTAYLSKIYVYGHSLVHNFAAGFAFNSSFCQI